jgi:hypothetical protein
MFDIRAGLPREVSASAIWSRVPPILGAVHGILLHWLRIYAAREWYTQGAALIYHSHATTPAFVRGCSLESACRALATATFYHTLARRRKGERG